MAGLLGDGERLDSGSNLLWKPGLVRARVSVPGDVVVLPFLLDTPNVACALDLPDRTCAPSSEHQCRTLVWHINASA